MIKNTFFFIWVIALLLAAGTISCGQKAQEEAVAGGDTDAQPSALPGPAKEKIVPIVVDAQASISGYGGDSAQGDVVGSSDGTDGGNDLQSNAGGSGTAAGESGGGEDDSDSNESSGYSLSFAYQAQNKIMVQWDSGSATRENIWYRFVVARNAPALRTLISINASAPQAVFMKWTLGATGATVYGVNPKNAYSYALLVKGSDGFVHVVASGEIESQ